MALTSLQRILCRVTLNQSAELDKLSKTQGNIRLIRGFTVEFDGNRIRAIRADAKRQVPSSQAPATKEGTL